jgi:hypothetical protein
VPGISYFLPVVNVNAIGLIRCLFGYKIMMYFQNFRLFFVVVIAIMSSCFSIHKGNIAGSVAINSPNFIYVKQNISGESSATYILGIGGLERESLIAEAKEDLAANHPLKGKQVYANYSTNFKTSIYLGLVIIVKCYLTADVVQFTEPGYQESSIAVPPPGKVQGRGDTIGDGVGLDSLLEIRKRNALESLNTEGLMLVFADTALKFYAHKYYMVKKSWQKNSITFSEANAALRENKELAGFFIPGIAELKAAMERKSVRSTIPAGIYWSQDEEDSSTMRCLDVATGKVVLKSKTAACLFLPMVAVKYLH